jgi:SdpC family antimicrobial peptide
MQSFRMSRVRSLAVLLAVTLLAASGGTSLVSAAGDDGVRQLRAHKAVSYDGETLYRGLVFGQGPVAQLFPELAQTPTASPEAAAAIDRLIKRMSELNPSFFARFAGSVQSGDRVRIRSALEDADAVTKEAIASLGGSLAASGNARGDQVEITIFVFEILAIAVAVVAVVDVAVVVAPAGAAVQEQTTLARTKWSDKIARALTT